MLDWAKQALGWLIGIVVVAVVVYFMGQITTLTCERVKGRVDCAMQSKFLGLVPLRERAVQDITGARVAQSCDDDGCTYRVELMTRAGMTPLTSSYSSGSAVKTNTARKVNAFVRDPTATPLRVTEHFDPTSLIGPALFIVGVFLWSRWRRYSASRHEQFVQQVADSQQATERGAVWGAKPVKRKLFNRESAVYLLPAIVLVVVLCAALCGSPYVGPPGGLLFLWVALLLVFQLRPFVEATMGRRPFALAAGIKSSIIPTFLMALFFVVSVELGCEPTIEFY